jgi:membrane protease YdiL (CAAX protease family)
MIGVRLRRLAFPVLAVLLVPGSLLISGAGAGRAVTVVATIGLLAAALEWGDAPGVRSAIAAATAMLLASTVPAWSWPAAGLLAPVVVWLASRRHPVLRPALSWLRPGRLGGMDLAWTTAVVAGSAAALALWALLARPDPGPYLTRLQSLPPVAAVAGLLAFAALNALGEEAMFRGLLQTELAAATGPAAAITWQAVGFGMLHWHGVPSGWAGMTLAGAYGLALGLLRARTGGLLAVWIAHAAADVTIGILALTVLAR